MKPLAEATDQELERAWKEYQERNPEPAPPLSSLEGVTEVWRAFHGEEEPSKVILGNLGFPALWFEAGRLFPPTPEGKTGAKLRIAQGIVPHQRSLTGWVEQAPDYMPVPPEPDWHRDLDRLYAWWMALRNNESQIDRMHIVDFVNKYKWPPVPAKDEQSDLDDLMQTCRSES